MLESGVVELVDSLFVDVEDSMVMALVLIVDEETNTTLDMEEDCTTEINNR